MDMDCCGEEERTDPPLNRGTGTRRRRVPCAAGGRGCIGGRVPWLPRNAALFFIQAP